METIAELTIKRNEMHEKILSFGDIDGEILRVAGDIGRARYAGNGGWEVRLERELAALRTKRGEYLALVKEYRVLSDRLDRLTDPKHPRFSGPIFPQEEKNMLL